MASRGLGTLTLDLVAKIGGFTAPLSQAERKLDATAKAMAAKSREIGARGVAIEEGFKRIGLSIGTIALSATAFLAKGVSSAIDAADNIDELSQRLGISAEKLSEWGYAAKLSGTDIESLSSAIPKLSQKIAEAADETSSAGELFKALGIDVKDSAGNLRQIDDVLPDIADKFKLLKNDTLEQSVAMELLGRSGAEMLEFLNRGGDGLDEFAQKARELGIVIDSETAAKAAEFKDELDNLKAVSQAFFVQVSSELLPKLIELSNNLIQLTKDGSSTKEIATQLGNAFEFVSEMAARSWNQLDGLGKIIEGLTEGFVQLWSAAKAFATLDFSGAASAFRNSTARSLITQGGIQAITGARAVGGTSTPSQGMDITLGAPIGPGETSSIESRLNRLLSGTDKAKKSKTGKSDEEKESERLQKAYESLNDSLKERVSLLGQEGEAAKIRYEIENGELQKLTQAQKDELIQRAEKLDLMNAEKDLQEKLNALDERRVEATKNILADNAFELEMLGKTVDQQDVLNNLRYAGVTANDAYGQSIIESTEALQEQRYATERQIELMDEFRSGASNALVDIVTGAKSAKQAFADFFDDLARRITQMIAERWIEQAFGQMGSTQTGSAGGLVGFAASLFGGGRAAGGAANAGMFYRVNESGPELLSIGGRDFLMMGNQSGMVRPMVNNRTSTSQTNIYVQGTATNETLRQIERANGIRAAREIARTGR